MDVVRVNPDETVRIITQLGDFTDRDPWHCHILEHEEQSMMRPFEVVASDSDGRDRNKGNDVERDNQRDTPDR